MEAVLGSNANWTNSKCTGRNVHRIKVLASYHGTLDECMKLIYDIIHSNRLPQYIDISVHELQIKHLRTVCMNLQGNLALIIYMIL